MAEETPTHPAQAAETAPEQPQNAPEASSAGNEPVDDVAALKKALAKANKDADRNRRRSEEAAAEAANAARAEMTQAIAEALGIKEPEKADPARLTEQLASQTAETTAARLELAVWRAAATVEANPSALLDSRSFMSTLNGIDPTDTSAVTDAIRAAVEANETLRAVPTRRVPGPNPAIGATGGSPTPEQVLAAAQADGNHQLVAQIKADQLLALQQGQPQHNR